MNKNRYIRQTTLKEVGLEGQKKLLETSVLVVGCGGLGNYVAVNLAASGIGKIHLIDHDKVNISNLHRQVFFTLKDIGKAKAKVLKSYIESINEDVNISHSIEKLQKNNARQIIKNYDFILECTDSLETKYMLNDSCVLENKPLVYGSLHKFEAQIASFNINVKNIFSANLRDIFPEMPTENIPTCSEVGTLNPIVGIAGLLQANEVLKLVLNIGEPLINKLLIYNSLDNSQLKINIKPQNKIDFYEIWNKNNYMKEETCDLLDTNEIGAKEFLAKVKNKTIKVISVLEEDTEIIKPDLHFPFSCFDADEIELKKNDYAILCANGRISMACVFMLRKKYPDYSFKSLNGGLYSIV